MLRRVAAKHGNHSGLEAGGNVQKIVKTALVERFQGSMMPRRRPIIAAWVRS